MSSTVIAKNLQVGVDGTASNNFTIYQPASPDGTLRIGNGNTGTTSAQVVLTSAGNVGIGTSAPGANGLEISRATGTTSVTPAVIRISTTSTGDWDANATWGALQFYSADTSDGGAKVQAQIGATTFSTSGGVADITFSSAAISTGTLTERMRIDSAGNVGIGTSSPNAQLHVVASNPTRGIVERIVNSAVSSQTGVQFQFAQNGIADWAIGQPAGVNAFAFWSGREPGADGSERMRIDSSGRLLIGTTAAYGGISRITVTGPNQANQQQIACHNPATSGTRFFISFGTEATYTERGYITWNGSTMALSNASDIRLKENIKEAPSALEKIEAVQIRSFDFKEDKRHVDFGVIAQELNQVIPSAVFEGSDNKDGSINKPWSVGLEPLIPILVKAIQEQQAIIESLKARLDAANL